MNQPFMVDHVNTSLEAFLDKLSKSEQKIRWAVECICRKNEWCFLSNRELAEQFNLHKITVSNAVSSLVKKGAIISEVENSRYGFRRRLKLNPKYKESKRKLVEEFNQQISSRYLKKKSKGVLAKRLIPISEKANTPQGKPNKFGELKSSIYNNDLYYVDSLSENQYQTSGLVSRTKDPSCPRDKASLPIKQSSLENQESDVSRPVHNSIGGKEVTDMSRGVDRVLQHWNSKGSPLTKHRPGGTSQYRKIVRVVGEALKVYPEKTITAAIDLYHQSLLNPSFTLYRYRNIQPTKVSLDEFFAFSVESLNMINVYKIESLRGFNSWFDLMKRGEQIIKDKFGIVPDDKYPVVTNLLKKVVTSWDRHPPIVGNEAEKQLRKSSTKLFEFHQRIKPRIIAWRRIVKISTPEFLKEYLIPYILNNLNLEQFRIYWLMSDKFLYNFERHLEEINVVSRPTMVRHKLKKRVDACDQDISFRGRGRAINHHGYDCERDLSAADF